MTTTDPTLFDQTNAGTTRPADGRPVARRDDPRESHDAARIAALSQQSIRDKAHFIVGVHQPVTSDEVIHWFGVYGWRGSDSGIRSRLNELKADGEITTSADTGESKLGNRARQWVTR